MIKEFIPLGYYVSGQLPSNFFIGEDILILGCSFYAFDKRRKRNLSLNRVLWGILARWYVPRSLEGPQIALILLVSVVPSFEVVDPSQGYALQQSHLGLQ